MRNLAAFALVFSIHWIGQFVAWSVADSPFTGRQAAAWDVLSFPVLPLFGGSGGLGFWQLLGLNSVVWAAAAVAALAAWSRVRTNPPTSSSPGPSRLS